MSKSRVLKPETLYTEPGDTLVSKTLRLEITNTEKSYTRQSRVTVGVIKSDHRGSNSYSHDDKVGENYQPC